MYDLLSEDLIGTCTIDGDRTVTLPALLALLCEGRVAGYTGLRAHQADPWHVFLVQAAASVLARNPRDLASADAEFWREGLLGLAEGRRSAWNLLEENVTEPAFLQHAWESLDADASSFGLKRADPTWVAEPKASSPDELDVLVTAKNHDVKVRRMMSSSPESWIYALLVSQTTSGFLGAGNYGVVRMNSGSGNRGFLSWVGSLNPSCRFQDEVVIVQRERQDLIRKYGYRARGVVLTWLGRWTRDGHQWDLRELEPFFIEACRPVRLRMVEGGRIVALGATSGARQIGPKSPDGGDVGDLWTVINGADKKKGRSALTVSGNGFAPKLVTDLLFEQQGFELSALQRPRPGSAPGWFVGSALVRGQGKTEGFHRLELPVPAKARLALSQPGEKQRLAALSQTLLTDAKEAESALRSALTALAEGGPDQLDFGRDAVERWVKVLMRRFVQWWNMNYFEVLWRGVEETEDVVKAAWDAKLSSVAEELLREAVTRLPGAANRRWRTDYRARGMLLGMLRKKGVWAGGRRTEGDAA